MQVKHTFGIEDDLVGDGGHVIGTLRVRFAIRNDELARFLELDELVADFLQGGR